MIYILTLQGVVDDWINIARWYCSVHKITQFISVIVIFDMLLHLILTLFHLFKSCLVELLVMNDHEIMCNYVIYLLWYVYTAL